MHGEETSHPERYHESFSSTQERFDALLRDMAESVANLSGEDQIEADFYKAALVKMSQREDFYQLMYGFTEARPELIRNHRRYMSLRVFQKMAVRDDKRYPDNFDQERWEEVIDTNLNNPDRRAELQHDLHHRHLQTNIADRYKSLPPLIAWMRAHDRIGPNLAVLDIGPSVNHGLKKLALIDILPGEYFSPTLAVEPADARRPHEVFSPASELTTAVNRLQNRPIGLTYGIGVDKEDMTDPDNEEWARACLTPREFKNLYIYQHDLLDRVRLKNVSLLHQDMLADAETEFLQSSPEDHGFFDVVTLFTWLNQLSELDRHRILRIARRYVKPTGLVVVQDFARVNPDSPVDIDFLDTSWNQNFSYRTIYMDMMEPTRYQEAWLYNGGRCTTAQATLGRLATAGSQDPVEFKEFLLNAA